MSEPAKAAFEREHERKPVDADAPWLSGYDTARKDNAAVMQLMADELKTWRGGQRIHESHNEAGKKLRARISELERQISKI